MHSKGRVVEAANNAATMYPSPLLADTDNHLGRQLMLPTHLQYGASHGHAGFAPCCYTQTYPTCTDTPKYPAPYCRAYLYLNPIYTDTP